MQIPNNIKKKIFEVNDSCFEELSIEMFRFQAENNKIYKDYIFFLNKTVKKVAEIHQIPFLPISFFKTKKITCSAQEHYEIVFKSSGTTGVNSFHYVYDTKLYTSSFTRAFELFYGNPADYCILALLPSYLENGNSSLVYMANSLIEATTHPQSGFYINNINELAGTLNSLESKNQKTILLGVSYALLDLASNFKFDLKNTIVMETGGMKGRKKELTRNELHEALKKGFGVSDIHSEYGMTELLSQAYSKGEGVYQTPPWMKIFIRDTNDPFTLIGNNKTGGINIIDLANIYSCCFIETQDLGIAYNNSSFFVSGRFDNTDIRGCNLLAL